MHLIGRYYHALEQKGRLSIPAGFRKQLGNKAILTFGLDGCLFMFATHNWQQVAKEASQLPFTKKQARDWVRYLSNNAVEVKFDRLGRILIPDYLRTHATLSKKVCIVGSLNRIEIWDQALYHTYLESIKNQAETIAESITQE